LEFEFYKRGDYLFLRSVLVPLPGLLIISRQLLEGIIRLYGIWELTLDWTREKIFIICSSGVGGLLDHEICATVMPKNHANIHFLDDNIGPDSIEGDVVSI
jgi:hypothetical protein